MPCTWPYKVCGTTVPGICLWYPDIPWINYWPNFTGAVQLNIINQNTEIQFIVWFPSSLNLLSPLELVLWEMRHAKMSRIHKVYKDGWQMKGKKTKKNKKQRIYLWKKICCHVWDPLIPWARRVTVNQYKSFRLITVIRWGNISIMIQQGTRAHWMVKWVLN